jgi:hypothetical protein
LHHEVDSLPLANAGHSEEFLEIQYAEAPHLDVVPKERSGLSKDLTRWTIVALDDVVRDQPMAALNEVQGTFALADPTSPEEQHPDLEHVDQNTVDPDARRKALVEEVVQRADGH